MRLAPGVEIDDQDLRTFCRAHAIRGLALYGSALDGDRFGPSSDIDLLVEFEPDDVPGLIHLAAMELRTSTDLSPYFRDEVVARARTLYAAA